jgi:hypothetical protein
MGGYGSTRWQNEYTRPVAEQALAFPIGELRSYLRCVLGNVLVGRGTLRWTLAKQQIAAISFYVLRSSEQPIAG